MYIYIGDHENQEHMNSALNIYICIFKLIKLARDLLGITTNKREGDPRARETADL